MTEKQKKIAILVVAAVVVWLLFFRGKKAHASESPCQKKRRHLRPV